MNWTAQQKIRLGFWLLAFVPLVLGVLAARNAFDLVEASNHVAAANEMSRRVEQMFSRIKDVEVAQREYILIGGEQPLNVIRKVHAEIEEHIAKLRESGADPVWLEHLTTLIPQKFDEIQKTIDLRAQSGPEAASQALLTNRGERAMDDIRTVIRNMSANQARQLQLRSDHQRSRFYVTLQLFAVVLLVNVALIAILYMLQGRENTRAREANEELERRVAQRTQALQRSNEDLQQFAYVASHDMKEPMRMISSYTTLLQRRYAGRLDEEADTFMNFIVDGVKRMNLLIEDLLEYSRAGAGKDDHMSDVAVDEVLANAIANLKVAIAESRALVQWEALPAVVHYDEMRLTQIFQNLISNAIKYRGDRRPVVRVRAIEQGGEIVFSVSDNGIGIEPEYLDRIFGIFQRLHGQEYEGTGIGLAMVKKIVERYGGRIWVESTPRTGSTFYFTVLKTEPEAAEGALSTAT